MPYKIKQLPLDSAVSATLPAGSKSEHFVDKEEFLVALDKDHTITILVDSADAEQFTDYFEHVEVEVSDGSDLTDASEEDKNEQKEEDK